MHDKKSWALAISQFNALRSNIPTSISEKLVIEYHEILKSLESATTEDLSSFRIPQDQLEPRVTSFRLASRRHPGSATYSREKFCNKDFFKRKVDALSQYLQALERSTQTQTNPNNLRDYWSMNNVELEALANKYNIGGYADQMGQIDRSIIIRELLKRDKALQPEKPTIQHHSITVGSMNGSVIQQGTSHSQAEVHFQIGDVKNLVEQIKTAMNDLPLSDEAKDELRSDVQTIEPQLSSLRPKLPIVGECLRSMRTILEGATGNATAIFLVHEITKYLDLLPH
jgi:hypothetical protein